MEKNKKYIYLITLYIIFFILFFCNNILSADDEPLWTIPKINDIYSLAISPDNKYIISQHNSWGNNIISIWELTTGRPVISFKNDPGENKYSTTINKLAISSDSKYIVSGSKDNIAKIFDLKSGKLVRSLISKSRVIYSADISHNNEYIITGNDNGTIDLWKLDTGELINTIKASKYIIHTVKFDLKDKYIIAGNCYEEIFIFNTKNGKLLNTFKNNHEKKLETHYADYYHSFVLSPDGKYLMSGSQDNSIKIWKIISGFRTKFIRSLKGHSSYINSVDISPDGKYIISGSKDKTAKLWDFKTGKLEVTITNHKKSVNACVFSKDSKYVITGSSDNSIKVWDLKTWDLITSIEGYHESITSIAISKNGKYLATGSTTSDRPLKIWILKTGELYKSFRRKSHYKSKMEYIGGKPYVIIDPVYDIYSVTFTPDSKYVIAGAQFGRIQTWNLETGKMHNEIIDYKIKNEESTDYGYSNERTISSKDFVTNVVISEKNKYLLTGNSYGAVRLWDFKDYTSYNPSLSFVGHKAEITSIDVSKDEKYVVSSSKDKSIKIWSLKNGKLIKTFIGHKDVINSVKISPDGKYMASCSDDKTIKVWTIPKGELVYNLKNHTNTVKSIAFSPDGKYLVSCGYDKTIRIWNILNGKQIKVIEEDHMIESLAISPDGKYIITGGSTLNPCIKLRKFPFLN